MRAVLTAVAVAVVVLGIVASIACSRSVRRPRRSESREGEFCGFRDAVAVERSSIS